MYVPIYVVRDSVVATRRAGEEGLVPVVRIDGEDVGEGRPGDLTHMLMAQYDLFVERHARAAVTRRHGR